MPRNANRSSVRSRIAGRAEEVEEGLGLRQPVEEDRRHAEGDERHVGRRPAGLEQAAPERAGMDPPLLVDERQWASRPRSRNQTVKVSPCERHSSRPNWAIIASVNAV